MGDLVYPSGCKPISEDLGHDELIRRLKVRHYIGTKSNVNIDRLCRRLWHTTFKQWHSRKTTPTKHTSHWPYIWLMITSYNINRVMFSYWLHVALLTYCVYSHLMHRTKIPIKWKRFSIFSFDSWTGWWTQRIRHSNDTFIYSKIWLMWSHSTCALKSKIRMKFSAIYSVWCLKLSSKIWSEVWWCNFEFRI